ncbi:MAG: hypothetical protein EOO89_04495 [Pedobacter sp.]|nr:MAG: hypothetical protein EOO89_04495 [Pedobacter sp.]
MYLKRLLFILLTTLGVCFLTGKYFDGVYKKNWEVLFFNTIDTLLDNSKQYNVVMLGNSRFHFGLNPYYIDSATGLNSYNFGIGGGGAGSLELYSLLYLQNHPAPDYVLINADVSLVVREEGLQTQFHLMHYLDNPVIYKYLKPYHSSLAFARYLPFSKYCFFDEYNRRSLFRKQIKFEVKEYNVYKGFFNNHEAGKLSFGMQVISKPVSDSSINMVKNVVDRFTNAGSIVILVSAPINDNISEQDKAFVAKADTIFESIATEYGCVYFQSEKASQYPDTYFVDELHLNEPGTRVFSRQIGNYIGGRMKTGK